LKKKRKKRVETAGMEDPVKELRNDGFSLAQIADELGISRSSVQNILRKIDEKEKIADLKTWEQALRDEKQALNRKDQTLTQRENKIEEKERRSKREIEEREKGADKKVAKIFRDAELELNKTKAQKEEYERRIGEIRNREKEANKFRDLLRELNLSLDDVTNVAHEYNSCSEETNRLKKALPKLREEYVREKKSRDEMRSKRLEEQKALDGYKNIRTRMDKELASTSYDVEYFQRQEAILIPEVVNLETRKKDLNKQIEEKTSSLHDVEVGYAESIEAYDDILSSWKSRIDEELNRYREEELSKLDREIKAKRSKYDEELEAKETKSKNLDAVISSKSDLVGEFDSRMVELRDKHLELETEIELDTKKRDSIEREMRHEDISLNLEKVGDALANTSIPHKIGKALANISKPKQPLFSSEPDVRAEVRKILLPAQPIPKTVIAQPIQEPEEVIEIIEPEPEMITESEEPKKEVRKVASKKRMGSSAKRLRSQRKRSGSTGEVRYPSRICPLFAIWR